MWIFPIGQSGEASRWRVCYQRGLPRLVFININIFSNCLWYCWICVLLLMTDDYCLFHQRVLQRKGKGPVAGRLPEAEGQTADGRRPPGLRIWIIPNLLYHLLQGYVDWITQAEELEAAEESNAIQIQVNTVVICWWWWWKSIGSLSQAREDSVRVVG